MPDLDDHLNAARDGISAMSPRADLWERAVDRASDPSRLVLAASLQQPWRKSPRWLVAAALSAVVALAATVLQTTDDDQSVATLPEAATTVPDAIGRVPAWSGVVREPSDTVQTMAVDESLAWDRNGEIAYDWSWDDPLDASQRWVDITRVRDSSTSSPRWDIVVAGLPPEPADLEADVVVSYGLVFDVTGDNTADYVVGLDTDARVKGDFRVWVTDLVTGERKEQDGPPYGFPVEFAYPTELGEGDGQPPTMLFTFIGGSPAGLQVETARFYAWSFVRRNGVVVAHDYAPNTGWITRGA